MKRAISSIAGSWIISLTIILSNFTLPDEINQYVQFAPLVILAIGHVYGGHRLSKKKVFG